MKVALIHMRYGFKGGLETRLHNYIDWFLKQGHTVTVFTHKIAPQISVPDGVTIERINLDRVPKPLRLLFFNRGVERLLKDQMFDLALSMGRTYSQPLLIAPNTHKGYLNAQDTLPYHVKDWVELYLDKRSFTACPSILACSEMVKQEIVDLYKIDGEKICVLPPPVNTKKYNRHPPAEKAALRERFGLSPKKKVFLFVSTSHKRKGIKVLQALFHLLPKEEYELALAGVETDYGMDNFKPLGFVQDMEALYHAADMTIHPAVYEPFGQIVSESLACGTPVIISNHTGAKQVVTEESGLIVTGNDPGRWHRAVQRAAEKTFTVPEDFVERYGLSLDHHMQQIIKANKALAH